jgi:hypothetical protein
MYISNTEGPEFDAWLDYMFENDQEMIEYFLEVFASSFGRCRHDEYIFIVNGKRADNGKTQMMIALTSVIGKKEPGYAVWLDPKAFSMSRTRNSTQPELIKAINKCAAIIDEPDKETMDIGMLKNASNTGVMSLRQLYEAAKEAHWTATVITLCNKLPSMDLKDAGTARRVVVIPIRTMITEEMKKAPRKYENGKYLKYGEYVAENEGPHILNRLLKAYKNYQERGYRLPATPVKVLEATESYIMKHNPVKLYIEEECTTANFPNGDKIPEHLRGQKPYYKADVLHTEFIAYCRDVLHQDKVMQVSGISDAMEALGYEYKRSLKDKRTLRQSVGAYEGVRPLWAGESKEKQPAQDEKVKYVLDLIGDMGKEFKAPGSTLKNAVAYESPLIDRVNTDKMVTLKELSAIIKKMSEVGEILQEKKDSKIYLSRT